MKKILLTFALFSFTFFFLGTNENIPVYLDETKNIEERVEDLLERMILEEKISLLGGTGFGTKAIERLGIPPLNMTDGPVGVRWEEATSFPSGISMAAAWDPELIYKVGEGIARDTKAKGRHVILGPCVNIARVPMGGRNFESFGEDPFLTSRLTVDYIKGVQNENVVATVKHFACNNQEFQRDFVDVIIDERTLNEIYLPAFKAAVQEADVLAVMSAYNKVNNHYCSENDYLLIDKLKNEWGFKGLVMSDWGAVHSSLPTTLSGLDVEMPFGDYLNIDSLKPAIDNGTLPIEKINDKIRRILRVMFTVGLFDKQQEEIKADSKENQNIAYETALASIVLLKNENNILPVSDEVKSIAVIGPNAKVARTGGGGSSKVTPFYSVSPLQALQEKLGEKVIINFSEGVMLDGETIPISAEHFFLPDEPDKNGIYAEYYDNQNLEGKPSIIRTENQIDFKWGDGSPSDEIAKDHYSARWTTLLKAPKDGEYLLDAVTDDGVRLFVNDNLVLEDWEDHAPKTNSYKIYMKKDELYKIKMEFYENGGSAVASLGWRTPDKDLFKNAVEIAKNSDMAILFVGTSEYFETEGSDRDDIELPNEQDELIKAVTEVNKNVVVVLSTGSPVVMDKWIDKVEGLVKIWFGGQEIGNATADVLLGNYNPSGKLPVTFPKKWEDCSAYKTYKAMDSTTYYDDGIFVGYRHFEKNNIEPLFPFGFGLSYTKFNLSNLKVEKGESNKIKVSCELKNTGEESGSEVIQLYIKDLKSSYPRPEKELKGFDKIYLEPGEAKTVILNLDDEDFSYFNPDTKKWFLEPGEFEILIGTSSKDIMLKEKI